MFTIIRTTLVCTVFSTLALTGCKPPAAGDLVSHRKLATFTIQQSNEHLSTFSTAVASYDFDSYVITYKTPNLAGDLITASGALHIPKKDRGARSPIISNQHGTSFLASHVPSRTLISPVHPGAPFGSLTASLGFITAQPDYLGYGASDEMEHPYSHSKTLASSSIDMLRASKKFLEEIHISDNNQLFLMGYSEGGKATLAMQRELSTKLSSEFTITASVPGAGNYDMSTTTQAVLVSETLAYPAYAAWFMQAYNSIYNLNMLDEIIQDDYLEATRTSFDGTQSGLEINAKLTAVTADLIKPSFKNSYLAGQEPEAAAVVAKNDDIDWAPQAPTKLFHGQADATIPFFNSTNALTKMTENGSTSVEVVPCNANGAMPNHSNCGDPHWNYAYDFFKSIATDL